MIAVVITCGSIGQDQSVRTSLSTDLLVTSMKPEWDVCPQRVKAAIISQKTQIHQSLKVKGCQDLVENMTQEFVPVAEVSILIMVVLHN
jgi:hypothetical protein